MGDKGEGEVKNFKKWVMSFMDNPLCKCVFIFLIQHMNPGDENTKVARNFNQLYDSGISLLHLKIHVLCPR